MAEQGGSAAETNWPAVFSMFLGVMGLVGAEFLPVSLLTPMAAGLGISEGVCGQAVTAVGICAAASSLLLAPLAKQCDRRIVLLSFSALLIIADLAVACAPNFAVLLAGRCCLGFCTGGFWSLAAATVLRLAAPHQVPKALSIVFGGVSAATLLAMPCAAYFGQFIGWRGVFAAAAALAAVTLFCQLKTLPPMPAAAAAQRSFPAMGRLLLTHWVALGLLAIMCSFAGYYALFTYLRPFFELRLGLRGGGLSLALLAFSAANCGGTFLAGFMLARFFRGTLFFCLIALAAVPAGLWLSGGHAGAAVALFMLWAACFGLSNVGWSTWIIRTMPAQAELAGGLMVAAIQLSIMLGAAMGGAVFDRSGISGLFPVSLAFSLAAILALRLSFQLFFRKMGRRA